MQRVQCPRVRLLLLCSILLVSACGTTVDDAALRTGEDGFGLAQSDGTSETGEAGVDGIVDPSTGGGAPGGAGAGSPVGPGATTPGANATSRKGSGSGGGGGGTGTGGRTAAAHPGVTDTEIRIGVPIVADMSALGTLGGELAALADPANIERAVSAVLDDINANGGSAGRKLVPLFHRMSLFTGTYAQHGQELCEHYTSDNKVLAVSMVAFNNELTLFPNCLARHKTVMLDGSNSLYFDDKEMAPFKSIYYRLGALALNRFEVYVDGLVAQGFLKKGDKIGLLRYDTPQQNRTADNVLKPALARHGLALTDEFRFTYTDDYSKTSSEAGTAAVLFNGQDIDRVLFLASGGGIPISFLPAAEAQDYHPKYGFSSADSPDFLADSLTPTSLEGARLVGWSASKDPDPAVTWESNATWKRCVAIMTKSGVPEPAKWGQMCDPFLFLDAALDDASVVSAAGVRSAVDRLGSSLLLSEPYITRLRPGYWNAIGATRDLAYQAGCKCFQYLSGPKPID